MGLISRQIWLCTIFYVDRAVNIILKNWTKSPPNSKAIKTSLIYSTESQKVYADQGTPCLHHKQNYTCPSKITFILYNSLLFCLFAFCGHSFYSCQFFLSFLFVLHLNTLYFLFKDLTVSLSNLPSLSS